MEGAKKLKEPPVGIDRGLGVKSSIGRASKKSSFKVYRLITLSF